MTDSEVISKQRLYFVGQAPSRESDGQPPFTGKCGKFLAELLGTTQDQMLADHDFINVLDRWPGKGLNGDKFDMMQGKINARKILPTLRDRTVILLGANVARVFGAKAFQYFSLYEIYNPADVKDLIVPKMAVVPHPSGVNRYWNKPENRDMARKFFGYILYPKA